MGNVYVVQENPKLNYMDAERFGDVVFMTSREYSPLKNSLVNKEITATIQGYMVGFNPDEDFLLLTGGPVLLGYAFYLGISKKGYINVLQWDGIKQAYLPIQFNP
jgi:hypothetical protein